MAELNACKVFYTRIMQVDIIILRIWVAMYVNFTETGVVSIFVRITIGLPASNFLTPIQEGKW